MSVDVLTFPNDRTPLDLLLYRFYKLEVPGLVEATLTQNPGLAAKGEFPPKGTVVNVKTPTPTSTVTARPLVKLYD